VSPPARKWRLNRRAALILAAVVLVGVPGFLLTRALQAQHGRKALLRQAQQLVRDKKQPELAQTYLNSYLDLAPEDAEAWDLKFQLAAERAYAPEHLLGAIKVGEQALRFDPSGPQRQQTLRRLVELYLKLGEQAPEAGRYTAARQLMEELKGKGEPSGKSAVTDPTLLRLGARVQEGVARLGNQEVNHKARDEAIKRYEEARKLDPKDVEGAERLARLYRDLAGDPGKAEEVLDKLVEANPSSAAYLARYRHFADAGPEAAADATEALKQALAVAPDDFDVRLAAAEDALRRNDTAAARGHLDALPAGRRDDQRVRYLRGMVDLQDNRADDAIINWRQGLLAAGGNNVELTWRLAFVLLQLGRIADAKPLMDQYRRLSGGEEPAAPYRLLEGLKSLKENRPLEAIPKLEQALKKIHPALVGQVHYLLGQAYEATRDEEQALEQYKKAGDVATSWAAPRLARIRLLSTRRPDLAEVELKLAAAELPEDPNLAVALARAELRRQERAVAGRARPAWGEFDRLLARARELAPGAGAVAQLEADRMAIDGRVDRALERLEQATRHDKANAELWAARAGALARLGRLDDALLVLEQGAAPEAAGDQAVLRIARARILTQQGHGSEARESLVRDLDRLPPNQRPSVWMELGNLYAGQRETAQARKAYREWARLLPNDPMPLLFLLELDLAVGDEKAVAEGIEKLQDIGAAHDLHYRVAQVLDLLRPHKGESQPEREERLAKAERLIGEIRDQDPQQRYADLLEGQLHERRGDLAKAAKSYEQAISHEGGPAALQRLAVIYAHLKKDDDLSRLQRERGDAAARLGQLAAETALQEGDKERAAKLADKVVAGAPDDVNARIWWARIYNTLGRPAEAEKALRDLIAKRRGEAQPWLALLALQVGRKQAEAARKTADEAAAAVTQGDYPELFHAECYRAAGDLAKADACYQEALKKHPDDPRVVREAAGFYEAAGRVDLAHRLLSALLGRDPSQRWAVRGLALIESAQAKNIEQWAPAYIRLGDPSATDTPEDRLARAIVLSRGPRDDQHREARAILERLLEDLPAGLATAATARGVLARLDLQAGTPELAAKAAALAKLDAGDGAAAAAVAFYAEALIRAKQLDEAERQLNRLALLAPDDLATTRLRARLLAARGRPEEAAGVLEKAYEARRDDPGAGALGHELTLELVALGRLDAAERLARALSQRKDYSAKATALLGFVLTKQGRPREAMDLYEEAVAKGDPAAMREAVQNALYLATGSKGKDAAMLDRAEAVLGKALEREPSAPDLLVQKGYLRHLQGKYEDEVQLYKDALAKSPDDLRFLNNLAWTLSEYLGRPQEALKWIEEAFRRTGAKGPNLLDTRGVILTRLGRLDEAIRDLEEAAKGKPDAAVYYHLARAYHKAGREADFRRARAAARQAGMTPERLDPVDREEMKALLFAGP
jgi:tetratricopeptide (TPR) repeat protein